MLLSAPVIKYHIMYEGYQLNQALTSAVAIEPASIKSILLCIENSLRYLCAAQANADWPYITQARAPKADFLILENNKKVTLCIKMPYYDAIVYIVWLMMLMSSQQ